MTTNSDPTASSSIEAIYSSYGTSSTPPSSPYVGLIVTEDTAD